MYFTIIVEIPSTSTTSINMLRCARETPNRSAMCTCRQNLKSNFMDRNKNQPKSKSVHPIKSSRLSPHANHRNEKMCPPLDMRTSFLCILHTQLSLVCEDHRGAFPYCCCSIRLWKRAALKKRECARLCLMKRTMFTYVCMYI